MDKAIKGSIIEGLGAMYPTAVKHNVTDCARVKTEH